MLSKESVQRIDDYFNLVKSVTPLPQAEMAKWRLLKKALPILHENMSNPSVSNEHIWAAMAIESVEKQGLCNAIQAQLIIEA